MKRAREAWKFGGSTPAPASSPADCCRTLPPSPGPSPPLHILRSAPLLPPLPRPPHLPTPPGPASPQYLVRYMRQVRSLPCSTGVFVLTVTPPPHPPAAPVIPPSPPPPRLPLPLPSSPSAPPTLPPPYLDWCGGTHAAGALPPLQHRGAWNDSGGVHWRHDHDCETAAGYDQRRRCYCCCCCHHCGRCCRQQPSSLRCHCPAPHCLSHCCCFSCCRRCCCRHGR